MLLYPLLLCPGFSLGWQFHTSTTVRSSFDSNASAARRHPHHPPPSPWHHYSFAGMTMGRNFGRIPPLWASTSESEDLPNVSNMRLSDIRQELESYGIPTKTFLEKNEMVQALETARAEGKTPKKKESTTAKSKNDTTTSVDEETSSSKEANRGTRIAKEMEKAKTMKVGELKKALQDMKISTKSMFEKTEFVRAYAEAIVDGVKSTSSKQSYDPEYRDVVIQKMSRGDPRMLQGVVIDVKITSS